MVVVLLGAWSRKGSPSGNGVLVIQLVFLTYTNQCIASIRLFCCLFFVHHELLIFKTLCSLLSGELPSPNGNVFEKEHFSSETPLGQWSTRAWFPMVTFCVVTVEGLQGFLLGV